MKAVFLDIGNTNTSFAFSTSKQKIEIISTKKLISEDYIKNFLLENSIETVVCASVVPNISDAFTSVCFKLNIICKILNFSNIPLQTNVENNQELGIDRVINAFHGISKFGNNFIVIDFGTALTFDIIFNKIYQGGMIFPGISIATESLYKKTAKLPQVKIENFSDGIGKNTIQAIKFGISIGYEGVLQNTVNFISKYYNHKFKVIFTGGCGAMFCKAIDNATYEENLIVEYLISSYNIIQ